LKTTTAELTRKDRELNELIRKYEILSRDSTATFNSKEQKLKKLEEKLLRESEEKFKGFLKEWKKSKDKKSVLEKYYKQFVRKPKKEDPIAAEKKRKEKLKTLLEVIKPGTTVRLENGSTKGVVEQIDEEKAIVIFGNVKAICEVVNLVPA
jgi:hypothetical protein